MSKTKEQKLKVFEFQLDGLVTYWVAANNLPEAIKCYGDETGLSDEHQDRD